MNEIPPDEGWCRFIHKAKQVMVVDPDDRNEEIANGLAQEHRP
jgi:hypothetical protein